MKPDLGFRGASARGRDKPYPADDGITLRFWSWRTKTLNAGLQTE